MGKPKEVLARMTSAKLSPGFTVRLDQIKLQPEDFRHRADADLNPDKRSMQALKKSLIIGGQKDPLVVYRVVANDGTVTFILVAGHRRFQAFTLLVEENAPGFSPDMEVSVAEILDGNRHDYLLWSVADNVIREQMAELHKLRAALLMLREAVDHTCIKVDLDLSDSTFDRYKRLAANLWMLAHVEKNEIGLTDAHLLLEAAGGSGGREALKDLQNDLARLVAVAKGKVQAKREELAERHKELKGSEAMVKSYFPAHLVKRWVLDLKHGKRISPRAKFVYAAAIESDKNGKRMVIPGLSLPLVPSNWDKFAAVVKTLNKFMKDLTFETNLLARQQLALQAWQDDDDGPTDWRSCGLDAVAELYDSVTPEDREATIREVNENHDREDRDREITPATDGIEINDRQPESDESDAE